MGWMDDMVIIGLRWSKSTFGVNNIYPEQAGIALLRLTLIFDSHMIFSIIHHWDHWDHRLTTELRIEIEKIILNQ